MRKFAVLCCLLFGLVEHTVVMAEDVIETIGGARLIGSIITFNPQHIVLQTDYAGEITINRDKVKGFSTREPVFVRLQNGTTITGIVSHDTQGSLVIAGRDASINTTADKIVESWQPQQKDPQVIRMEQQHAALQRSWIYKAAVDIAGKSGNSEELGTDVNAVAELVSVHDTLKFYGTLERAEKDGDETSDEIIIGADYTAYFNEPWGWFVRAELERDEFEDLDLRTSLGAGISYRLLNKPHHGLVLRAGAGYRFENFMDDTNEDSPTLDFGLDHKWQFASWGRVSNLLTFLPAVTDVGDYLFVQDSALEMPLGLSARWILRLGIRNDFKSRPAEGREELDSSYYSRLQLTWD